MLFIKLIPKYPIFVVAIVNGSFFKKHVFSIAGINKATDFQMLDLLSCLFG